MEEFRGRQKSFMLNINHSKYTKSVRKGNVSYVRGSYFSLVYATLCWSSSHI